MQTVNLNDLSFDAVIPSALLLNENIEPNAIKLYAFVRGLTRAHGYCYASNSYLSQCMKCDESTVKRLLSSLKTEGFIEIHTNKEGMHWQRHIFLAVGFKNCLRRLENEPPPAQNQAPPSSKMSPNKRYIIEDREKEEPPPSACPHPKAGDVTSLLIECIKKTKPDLKKPTEKSWQATIEKMLRIDKRSVEMAKKIIEWLPTSEFWSKNILSAESFRNQFDKLELAMKGKGSNSAQNDLNLIRKIEAHPNLVKSGIVVTGHDYVEFSSIAGAYFKAGEPGFRDKVVSTLRKMNVPINL